MTPQRPRKRPRRERPNVRFGVSAQLTKQEIRRLLARAKADRRSMADYVAGLIQEDLRKRRTGVSRRVRGAGPRDRREAYVIGMTVTADLRERVEVRAEREGRSISSYVAKVIVEAMRR